MIVFLLNMRLRACLADGSKYHDLKLLLFSLLLRRECQRPTRRRKNNLGTRENGSSTHKANTNLDAAPEKSFLRCVARFCGLPGGAKSGHGINVDAEEERGNRVIAQFELTLGQCVQAPAVALR